MVIRHDKDDIGSFGGGSLDRLRPSRTAENEKAEDEEGYIFHRHLDVESKFPRN